MMTVEKDVLKDRIKQFNWYHAIEFADGVVTPGRFPPHIPPNYTLFPVFYFLENINLQGIDCIDIGTTDGLVSFVVKSEGASQVVATDRGARDTFQFGCQTLDLDIHYLPGSTLDGGALRDKLQAKSLPTKYDLVVLSGVIYHSYDPLLVMMHARTLLKPNGLFIVESAIAPGNKEALFLNWEIEKPVEEVNTYFLPTLNSLEGLIRFCSCSSLSVIQNGNRGAVIGRACQPSQIDDCPDMLKKIIEKGACYGPIDYAQLEAGDDGTPPSDIHYSGMRGRLSINSQMFSTRFQLQPSFTYTGKSPLIEQPVKLSESNQETLRSEKLSKQNSGDTISPQIPPNKSDSSTSGSKAGKTPFVAAHTQSTNESKASTSQRAKNLIGRIINYYSRWPIAIATLAITLNTISFLLEEPYQWIFIASGTTLLLFLVGHAASKADYVLDEVEDIRNKAKL